MDIFWLCFIIFIIFSIWILYSSITDLVHNEGIQLTNYRKIIQHQHERGQITDDEYYEKYYDYKEKRKDWEIKSGFAAMREREHPYWKDYYRRHKEWKEEKLKEK